MTFCERGNEKICENVEWFEDRKTPRKMPEVNGKSTKMGRETGVCGKRFLDSRDKVYTAEKKVDKKWCIQNVFISWTK